MSKNRRSRRISLTILVLTLAAIAAGCIAQNADTSPRAVANKKWAKKLNLPGAPNLYKVSDDLYRGAQPTNEGFKQLEKLGVKTVINLRAFHSDRDELKDVNLRYVHIHTTVWLSENKDIVRFLKVATDANLTPVFVHCQRGSDRTGTMCAIYRIAVQGWSKDEAIEEMTEGGFGFYSMWQNLIDYIRKLNIEKIREQAGIPIHRD